jgi:hypothetical protein
MRKNMVGEVIAVVIDEIGEVTFLRDPMFPAVVEIKDKETTERALAAVVELLDICATVLPTSPAQFEVLKAKELLLKDFKWLLERLTEQVEFTDCIRSGC